FNQLDDYMRPACYACNDFTNIFADLSFGGLGSPDKYTTVVTRTDKGQEILSKVISDGVILASKLDESKKNKMIELITQFSRSKIARKEKFMKTLE
ncbi:hypothetical protein LCGC14_0915330, partial [marine sediment metagenome]